jgi:hypothetical protein
MGTGMGMGWEEVERAGQQEAGETGGLGTTREAGRTDERNKKEENRMPLFDATAIDDAAVASASKAAWGFTLGDRLKASQNVTYAAVAADG